MKKKGLTIKLNTLTPIWTGNAFGRCDEIKGQSIYGGLRFWFELYCKSVGISVKDYNSEELNEKVYRKNLRYILKNNKMLNMDEARKEILDRCNISLTSQIFGCKGLKGNFEIQDIKGKEENIDKNDIDFKYLGENIEFWIKKVLFNNSDSIKCYSDIVVKARISEIYLKQFIRFLSFYEGKVILIGGKNSQGFGFTKLFSGKLPLNGPDKGEEEKQVYLFKRLDLKRKGRINKVSDKNTDDKKILGYSFKYYCRKKENNKKKRKQNFGKMGIGSRFYFSNAVKYNGNKCIYIIGFPKNNINEDSNFRDDFDKYCNWLKEV